MPSPAKAIFDLAALAGSAAALAGAALAGHPWRVVALMLALTGVLYAAGVWQPVDWWGDREVPR